MTPPLAAASERLRSVEGFPKRAGRPRKPSRTGDDLMPPSVETLRSSRKRRPAPLSELSPPLETADVDKPIKEAIHKALNLTPRLLGDEDAGAYLGSSAWTARQLVERAELRLVKLPGIKRWLVDVRDLDALIEKWKA
jgi:hypothetical protein